MSDIATMNVSAIPELLLPAGDFSRLKMAFYYGADAVYVGADALSMRPNMVAFDIDTLAEAIEYTHRQKKKIYVAANIVMAENDLPILKEWLVNTKDLNFDGLIVSDLGALALARQIRPEIDIHISTQLSASNSEAVKLLGSLGAKRVVLARECTLDDTKKIVEASGLEIEVFVHGAMCVAVSGRCLLSAHLCGYSGNRGECKHSCRWEWQLVEQKRPGEPITAFEDGKRTIFLGSKDLCLIEHIPQLIETGVTSLKVEGRMKSDYYVATVARAYRAALDRYAQNEDYEFDPHWLEELNAVSHRPFSTGFAFGYPTENPQSLQAYNKTDSDCKLIGYVDEIDDGFLIVHVKNPFTAGESFEWIGPGYTSGKLTIAHIESLKGKAIERTISATSVRVEIKESNPPPLHSVIRKRVK